MTYEQAKEIIRKRLENENIVVDDNNKGGLTFSLIELGLQGVYVEVSKEEIEYYAENTEGEIN